MTKKEAAQAGRNTASAQTQTQTSGATNGDAFALLKADHRKVEEIFKQYEAAGEDKQKKTELAKQVCQELIIHTLLEEEIFYPACREKEVEHDSLDEAQVEHDGAKVMIADIMFGSPDDPYFDAKVSVLSEYIKHHVQEEEKPRSGIFAKAKKAELDAAELGMRLQTRKTQLTEQAERLLQQPLQAKSIHLQDIQPAEEEGSMARYSNQRDRDEQGRFTNEDDDDDRGYGRGSSRGYSSRSSRGYSEDRSGRERDEQGRFMSEGDDDDDRYSRRSSGSRDYGEGRGQSRGQGHGGWYGDPEGHAEASERGWESRGRSQSSRNEGGRSYGRSSNERDRDEQGRFTSEDDDDRYSSRGGRQSRSGGRGYESERGGSGHGGWFGDSRGHAEAAERGWEHRGGGRSSRDDEDDDRSSRSGRSSQGRGHGGWYGDPEGHSQASRRGHNR